MIIYDHQLEELTIHCDDCSSADTFDGVFQEAITEAKNQGWRAYKDGSGWKNYCPSCS